MIRNPCRQDWEAAPTLPVRIINWDAIKCRVLQGGKNELEYVLLGVGVHLSQVLICFRGLGEFGGTGNRARSRTAIDPGLLRRADQQFPSVI